MATTDRTASARPVLGGRVPGRVRPGGVAVPPALARGHPGGHVRGRRRLCRQRLPPRPAGYNAFAFALVSAIMMGRRAFAWGTLAAACVAFTWLPSLIPDAVEKARGLVGAATNLAWLPLVGAASEIARIRLERRAEQAHVEREEARRRASEERLLIARELHDALAHNISLINVQSGVALHGSAPPAGCASSGGPIRAPVWNELPDERSAPSSGPAGGR